MIKTNTELHDELVNLASALAISAQREKDVPDVIERINKMRHDRDSLMEMWMEMHFNHIITHGDCSKYC